VYKADINSLNALIYIINNNINDWSKYYKNAYLFNWGPDKQDNKFKNLEKTNYFKNKHNLIKFDLFKFNGVWEDLTSLIEIFNKQIIEKNTIKPIPGLKHFNSDYEIFIQEYNERINHYLTKENLLKLQLEINKKITGIYTWYYDMFKGLNAKFNNTFNLNFNIIQYIGYGTEYFLNQYINLKKLFILKEQVDSLLSIQETDLYDCTDIYNLIVIKPLYVDKPYPIYLAYLEYLLGYVIRSKQYEFTINLFEELTQNKKQSIH
jgi:hypothetical protein